MAFRQINNLYNKRGNVKMTVAKKTKFNIKIDRSRDSTTDLGQF